MRDFKTLPEALEAKARQCDPGAWRSADTPGEAFDLKYRRERARQALSPDAPAEGGE